MGEAKRRRHAQMAGQRCGGCNKKLDAPGPGTGVLIETGEDGRAHVVLFCDQVCETRRDDLLNGASFLDCIRVLRNKMRVVDAPCDQCGNAGTWLKGGRRVTCWLCVQAGAPPAGLVRTVNYWLGRWCKKHGVERQTVVDLVAASTGEDPMAVRTKIMVLADGGPAPTHPV